MMSCNKVVVSGLEMSQCLMGGNMCDDCFKDSLAHSRSQLDDWFESMLISKGIRKEKKEVPPIEVFEENKELEGVLSVYELTLTTTKDDPYELRQYFKKICDSKMFDVKGFKACFELCKNGNPHIHAMLWSGKKHLNTNHIKEKIKFPYRFTLAYVRLQDNFYNYILKNKDSTDIIEYCQKKGIVQQWSSIENENQLTENVESESQ